MTNNNFIKQLESISVPVMEMKDHQVDLRQELLASSYWDEKNTHWYKSFWKGGEYMKFTKILPIGALAILVLMLGMFVVGSAFNAKSASAQEIINAAYKKGVALDPTQRAQIEKQINADLIASLNEAKSASDLTIVTPQESFLKKNGEVWAGTSGTQNFDVKKLDAKDIKVLRYTDPKGAAVLLVVDDNDNVIMKFTKIDQNSVQKMTTPDGQQMIGIPGSNTAPAE
jgi:hypothetical protein